MTNVTAREPTPALLKTKLDETEIEINKTDAQENLVRKMHKKQASGSSSNFTQDKKPQIKIKKCILCKDF